MATSNHTKHCIEFDGEWDCSRSCGVNQYRHKTRGMSHRTSALTTFETPQWLVERIRMVLSGQIDLDPCTIVSNPVGAIEFFTPDDDGLAQDWAYSAQTIYINPPYGSQIQLWTDKAILHHVRDKCDVVLLLPSRTDSKWFQRLAKSATDILFIQGRIKFDGHSNVAKFPNVIIGLGTELELLADLGWLVRGRDGDEQS